MSTAHKDQKFMTEHYDPPDVLEAKVDKLVELVTQVANMIKARAKARTRASGKVRKGRTPLLVVLSLLIFKVLLS